MGICQYCEGNHQSSICEKYATDRTRKMIAVKKKFCHFCFVKSDKIHLPNIKECPTNEKCIGWYSVDHHSAFCSERVKGMAQNLFLPKINQNLFHRFFQTFDLEEQLAFVLSSQDAQKYVPLKNIKLAHLFSYGICRREINCSDDIIVFIHLSVQELSQFIGSHTKEISISEISSNIAFVEIIRNAPNIEILNIFDKSWISKQATWLEDLYKYKEGNNFRELFFELNNIVFNIETLKKFVETKSSNGVIIKIKYENREKQEEFHRFADKMSKIFIEDSHPEDDKIPHIKLEFERISDYKCFTLNMNKNDGPPLKKRQK